MKKFNFLIGDWSMKYTIPKSKFGERATGEGNGTFKKALNDQYVFFDYRAKFTTGSAQAHGIFARDDANKCYRYWWFEDSGNFQTATCNFLNKNTLFLSWREALLIQTFERISEDRIILTMSQPVDKQNFEPVLIVDFVRKQLK